MLFKRGSGQKINKSKSCFMLHQKVYEVRKEIIRTSTGFIHNQFQVTYLGEPLYSGRLTTRLFDELMGQIQRRLAGWKSKLLSQGGKLILLKHVLSSIPIHMLSAMATPSGVLKRLEKMFADFFWG